MTLIERIGQIHEAASCACNDVNGISRVCIDLDNQDPEEMISLSFHGSRGYDPQLKRMFHHIHSGIITINIYSIEMT